MTPRELVRRTLEYSRPERVEDAIRRKSREMLDTLWQGRGGFVAGCYGDNVSIGLDPKWQGYARDEFSKSGHSSRYDKDNESATPGAIE